MNYTEAALTLPCGGETLVGIVSLPDRPVATGVLVIVGGPQYRVGSHRQFVLLARALAEAGHPVMRFDYRGMGDSTGEPCGFEAAQDDVAAALAAFRRTVPGLARVVLFGLCDGASAALLQLQARPDPLIGGLCLLNPWVRSEATLARTHVKHYYGRRLFERAFWQKLVGGRFDWRAAGQGLWRNLRQAVAPPVADAPGFPQRMREALARFGGPVLLVLSGDDYTAKEFSEVAATDPAWRRTLARPGIERLVIEDADHTLSRAAWREPVEHSIVAWLARLAPEKGRTA